MSVATRATNEKKTIRIKHVLSCALEKFRLQGDDDDDADAADGAAATADRDPYTAAAAEPDNLVGESRYTSPLNRGSISSGYVLVSVSPFG